MGDPGAVVLLGQHVAEPGLQPSPYRGGGILGFDLAGVTFLDCTGIRALSIAARLAPGCRPVIIRSLSPMARRIAELLDLDLANLRGLSLGRELPDGLRDGRTGQQELAPAEPGTPFLAGTKGCP
jgi:hypothetical protein